MVARMWVERIGELVLGAIGDGIGMTGAAQQI